MFDGLLFNELIHYLCPNDLIILLKLFPSKIKQILQAYETNSTEIIDNWFKLYFKTKYPEFVKQMWKNKAIISGSFILQCIWNETWEESDIDIFIPIQNVQLKNTNSQNGRTPITLLEEFLYTDHSNCYTYNASRYGSAFSRKDLDVIRNYKRGQSKKRKSTFGDSLKLNPCTNSVIFQTILVKTSPTISKITEFMYKNFDFNICKNVFYYDENGKAHIQLSNKYQIMTHQTEFNAKISCDETFYKRIFIDLKRYNKYNHNGVKFIPNNKFKNNFFDVVKKKRCCMLNDTNYIYHGTLIHNNQDLHFIKCHDYDTDIDIAQIITNYNFYTTRCNKNCPLKIYGFDKNSHIHICQNSTNMIVILS